MDNSILYINMSLGTATAVSIVNVDTLSLIARANEIVQNCTGTNCNTSPETQRQINEQLSALAQSQATSTQSLLSVPSTSVVGRNIYESYLNLAAVVAATYNYQCGANITNSVTCVTNASAVQTAQQNLKTVLLQPAQTGANHVVVIILLISLMLLGFLLFFIFFTIGLFT